MSFDALKHEILSQKGIVSIAELSDKGYKDLIYAKFNNIQNAQKVYSDYVNYIIDNYEVNTVEDFMIIDYRCSLIKNWLDNHNAETNCTFWDLGGQDRFRPSQMGVVAGTKIAELTLPIDELLMYEMGGQGIDAEEALTNFFYSLVVGSGNKSFEHLSLLRTKLDTILLDDEIYDGEEDDEPDYNTRVQKRIDKLYELEKRDRSFSEDSLFTRLLNIYDLDYVRDNKTKIVEIMQDNGFKVNALDKYVTWVMALAASKENFKRTDDDAVIKEKVEKYVKVDNLEALIAQWKKRGSDDIKTPDIIGTDYSSMFYSIPPFSIFGPSRLVASQYDSTKDVKVVFAGTGGSGKSTFALKVQTDQYIVRLESKEYPEEEKIKQITDKTSNLYSMYRAAEMTVGFSFSTLTFDNNDLSHINNIIATAASMRPAAFEGFEAPEGVDKEAFLNKKFEIRPKVLINSIPNLKKEVSIAVDLGNKINELRDVARKEQKQDIKRFTAEWEANNPGATKQESGIAFKMIQDDSKNKANERIKNGEKNLGQEIVGPFAPELSRLKHLNWV